MRALALAVFLTAVPAFAGGGRLTLQPFDDPETPRWAFGLMVGVPTGVTVKRYLGGSAAWQAHFAFANGPGLRVGWDYLVGQSELEEHEKFALNPYVGIGGVAGLFKGSCALGFFDNDCGGDVYAGVHVPLGAEVLLKEVPLTFGVEVAPGLGVAPGRVGFLLDVLFALRLTFI